MTDNEFTAEPLWDEAVAVLRQHGPMTEDDLIDHLEEEGAGSADSIRFLLDADDPHPLVVWLLDGRVAAMDALLEGRVFTHRLTAFEIAWDAIGTNDVEATLWLVSEDDDFEVVFGEQSHNAMLGRGAGENDPIPFQAIVFPPGTLAGRKEGDLVALSVNAGRVTFVPEPGEPQPVPALAKAVEDAMRDDGTATLEDVVPSLLAVAPGVFTRPAPPLTEALTDAGFDRHGIFVAPAGFDFRAHSDQAMVELYADQVGVPVEAVPGVALFASLVDALDSGDDVDLVARFSEGKAGLYVALADPDVAEIVLDDLLDETIAPKAVERAALWAVEHAPRGAAPALLWIAGKAAEADGRVDEAERHFAASSERDPDFELALIAEARFAFDRGDAVRALTVLSRVPGADELPFFDALTAYQPVERADLGRNDRCWCGSGRKYKVCHLGRAEFSLEERAEALYVKACLQLSQPWWAGDRAELAEARAGYVDDDEEFARVFGTDPLLDDVLLLEGGGLAEFVEHRGHLLPEDERELAQVWLGTERSVYEIASVEAGEGVTLRDLRSGDSVAVSAPGAGEDVPIGMRLCAWVLPVGSTSQLLGALTSLAASQVDAVVRLLDAGEVDPLELVEALSFALDEDALSDEIPR